MRSNLCAMALAVVSLVPFGLCCGCTNAVIFSTSYLAGIELSPAENGQQSAKVALQKFEGVAMPGCKDPETYAICSTPCKEVLPQAYSTLALSYLDTGTLLLGGLTNVSIKQVFATGAAAQRAGASGAAVKAFTAIATSYGPDQTSECISVWLKGDTDGSRVALVKQWWTAHGPGGNAHFLISGAPYARERQQFVSENPIACP